MAIRAGVVAIRAGFVAIRAGVVAIRAGVVAIHAGFVAIRLFLCVCTELNRRFRFFFGQLKAVTAMVTLANTMLVMQVLPQDVAILTCLP